MIASSAQELRLVARPARSMLIPLLGAMLLGAIMVFVAGFSSIAAVHNAAHDVRHASNFPCH
jgi:cobalt transporter subunit CbtB